MKPQSKTLYVYTLVQAVLMEHELLGQISDGNWENARPYDHYKSWSYIKIRVTKNVNELGRDFYAIKDNYNFTDRDLLDCVGERMLYMARLADKYPEVVNRLLELEHSYFPEHARWYYYLADTSDHYQKLLDELDPDDDSYERHRESLERARDYYLKVTAEYIEAGLTDEMLASVDGHTEFTMKDMKQHLLFLKKIIRRHIGYDTGGVDLPEYFMSSEERAALKARRLFEKREEQRAEKLAASKRDADKLRKIGKTVNTLMNELRTENDVGGIGYVLAKADDLVQLINDLARKHEQEAANDQ